MITRLTYENMVPWIRNKNSVFLTIRTTHQGVDAMKISLLLYKDANTLILHWPFYMALHKYDKHILYGSIVFSLLLFNTK